MLSQLPVGEVVVRPMTAEVADAAARVMEVSSEERNRQDGYTPEPMSPERRAAFYRRVARFCDSDPDGCFVAEDADGEVVGMAASVRRGAFWGLSLFFVHPDHQSAGIGRMLLASALRSADGARVAMIMSSPDPRAMRRYALAGFDLHPGIWFEGEVDRSALPATTATRIVDSGDLDLVDDVDLRLRGSSRRPDVEYSLGEGARLFAAERGRERGYALTREGHLVLLGADNVGVARDLVWRVVAEMPTGDKAELYGFTAEQRWVFPVLFAVRLSPRSGGALFVRGLDRPPAAWVPSGWYF